MWERFGPWGVIGGFIAGLVAIVLAGLRSLLTGKLVPGKLHDEVRVDRDNYKTAAETALTATREMSANVARMTVTMEKMADSQREMLALLRQVAPPERSAA